MFSKYIGQGVPLPPLQKNFIADLDELEHEKKDVKMSKFWDDPPLSCENSQLSFVFSNEYLPYDTFIGKTSGQTFLCILCCLFMISKGLRFIKKFSKKFEIFFQL